MSLSTRCNKEPITHSVRLSGRGSIFFVELSGGLIRVVKFGQRTFWTFLLDYRSVGNSQDSNTKNALSQLPSTASPLDNLAPPSPSSSIFLLVLGDGPFGLAIGNDLVHLGNNDLENAGT
jgi:hypothetical protein